MVNPKDIADMFAELEIYLIRSFKRNLQRHKDWEKKDGFEWSAWQAEKLRELNKFRRENRTIADDYMSRILPETKEMLAQQYKEGSQNQTTPSFFGINERRLNALIDEMQNVEENAVSAALRTVDDVYRQTVLKRTAALNSGTMTLYQAIDSASADFLEKGINCIQYKSTDPDKPGRRVNIVSYTEMALRTNAKRSRLYGQRAKMREMGIDTVAVSRYGACSPTCLPWQGKTYIDDVFGAFDETKGKKGVSWGVSSNGESYLLLSYAMKNGLFHPNCRHDMRIWFEGTSQMPPAMDRDRINKVYALEQKQRALERRVRRAKRFEVGTLDPDKKKEYTAQRKRAQKRLRDFIKEHDDLLRRNYWREKNVFAENPETPSLQSEKKLTEKEIKEYLTKQVLALPREQKDVLQRYTGALATRINNGIKNNRINNRLKKDIELLDRALENGIMPETVVLHRDTVFDWLGIDVKKEEIKGSIKKIKGRTANNDIFTSTSFNNLGLPARDTEIYLTVPKGFKGCQYLKPVAHKKYENQEEVLFARGLSYIIKSAKIENEKFILEAEVVTND